MTDSHDVKRLAMVRAGRAGGESRPTPHCLDDDSIAALAEGAPDAEARAAGVAHLAVCERCRRAVASVARALTDPAVAREVRAAELAGRRRVQRFGWAALGVAAAAAVLLLVVPPGLEEPVPPHRALPITAAPAPEAVGPVGPVAEARSLRWTPVSGADRYRVTLFDADGAVRYETELAGTVVDLPDSVLPAPGVPQWWRVEARLGFDRWVASALFEFSVERGRRR
jgi:hypothetical protein